MRGILLAGGNGTRLRPLTQVLSKQLLPVYDKPMVYYALSVLMLANIRDVLVISSGAHIGLLRALLGDGARVGMNITYAEQAKPNGIAEAFLIGADHIGDDNVALILGDNFFYGDNFSATLRTEAADVDGCVLFGHKVTDPERYGVAEVDQDGRLLTIEEKPLRPRSNLAVTGLYFYDNKVVDIAKNIQVSARGELEISDVNQVYVEQGRARLVTLGRGFAWLDTGTRDSLLQASQYVQMMEQRQGLRIACIEEIALRMGFIDLAACERLAVEFGNSDYGNYLRTVTADLA
ncbi:glucose-1-phosphate thymidylyltransferase RfbA [Nocardia sp. NPDC050175]|uniref:glucose-1-phosphate thymidylyltransferase RfbA n=1 Tax=Nocardia sp. NPDC050175 TaxID=3364317 RepID=UPI00379EE79F